MSHPAAFQVGLGIHVEPEVLDGEGIGGRIVAGCARHVDCATEAALEPRLSSTRPSRRQDRQRLDLDRPPLGPEFFPTSALPISFVAAG